MDDVAAARALDRRLRELLEACHEIQRNRHALAGTQAEEQQGLHLGRGPGFDGLAVGPGPLAGVAQDAGALGDPEDVQNQGDVAVTHDGGAREHVHALELLAERLDDDLLGVVDLVDHEPELPVAGLEHHDGRGAVARGGLDAEHRVEVQQRQQVAPELVEERVVDALELGARLLGLEADELEQAHLRDGVAIAAGRHHQRRDDGQRQRNLDLERRALAHDALDVHLPADALDVGLDDVHADAAARDVGDLLGRREARQEDELDQVVIAHTARLVRGDQPALNRLVRGPSPG
ncbi:MAG: hypothetical protein R2712_04945 [Vicinamibacterales bacterium]